MTDQVPTGAAPNFGTSEYPMAGERLAPAWQAAWDLLADGAMRPRGQVLAHMVASSDVVEKTALGLLQQAKNHRLIGRLSRSERGKRVVYVWRTDMQQ